MMLTRGRAVFLGAGGGNLGKPIQCLSMFIIFIIQSQTPKTPKYMHANN
jgi:hypothetical protein